MRQPLSITEVILVREATPDDAGAIAEVMIGGMRSAFDGLVPQHCLEWPDSAANWKKSLANGLGEGVFLDVAQTSDGRVAGYVMGGPYDDPAYRGELKQLQVLPSYQRQGIGSSLVRHVARRLAAERDIHSLCVKVLRANPNRIFYERLGGQYVSEHPYDWDGVMMSECTYGWVDTRGLIEG